MANYLGNLTLLITDFLQNLYLVSYLLRKLHIAIQVASPYFGQFEELTILP